MNEYCLCNKSSDSTGGKSRDEDEREAMQCNRIFLNFTRERCHPAMDKLILVKVKELFKYLSERQDLQEMKVSGWLDEEELKSELENEEGEVEEEKDELDMYFEEGSTSRGGGQRFTMSRDFWYRKLNTLKARKLDEVALEAKDMPPDDDPNKQPKGMSLVTKHKVYASQVGEQRGDVLREIAEFNEAVAKPVEKELKTRFVNVYNNKKHFTGGCS